MSTATAPTPTRSPDPAAEAAVLALERPDSALLTLYVIKSLAALIFAPIVLVPLFFRYHTLRYKLDAEGVSMSWGILFRREIHLTYRRIQDIHVHRNLIERWLGIARVEIQTASGTADAEMALEGIRDHEAVRDFLYGRMRGHELATGVKPAAPGAEPVVAPDAVASGGEAELVALLREVRDELAAERAALESRS